MSQVSAKLRKNKTAYVHYCPGCESMHSIPVVPQRNGACWKFNGDVNEPTFEPSINNRWGNAIPGQEGKHACGGVCHYIITAGQIQFCADSTHKLSGQKVPLPDLPARYQDGPQCMWSDGDE